SSKNIWDEDVLRSPFSVLRSAFSVRGSNGNGTGTENRERRTENDMAPRLSVNVNKVATLRNSRGGRVPSVVEAVEICIAAGAPGITVHPRRDRRHITPEDVREIARTLRGRKQHVEYNIEGDPRPDLLELVHDV